MKIPTAVDVLAIGSTDDHPAYEDVRPWIAAALDGPNVLLVPDYYSIRAQYIVTSAFGARDVDVRNTVRSLVLSPARIVGATDTALLDAYEIGVEKRHDVYDSFVVAVARAHADYLVTADDDFDYLCADEHVTSRNPIPDDTLSCRTYASTDRDRSGPRSLPR